MCIRDSLLVGVMGSNYVEVIDWRARQSVKKIVTGDGAHNFQARGDGRQVFVSNRVDNSIAIVDQQTLTLVDKFPVPGGPDCMEVSRDGKQLWVTSRFIRQVQVVDLGTKKIVRSIAVGRSPHGVFFKTHAARQ